MSKLIAGLLLGVLTGLAQAATSSNAIQIHTNLVPVLAELDSTGRPTGFAVDVARGIVRTAGLKADVVITPFARALHEVSTSAGTALPAIARTPERENLFHWITPVVASEVTLYVRAEHARADKPVTSIAVVRNDFRQALARQEGITNLVPVTTWRQALLAVQKGRVDGVLLSPSGFRAQCAQPDLRCDSLMATSSYLPFLTYLAVSRKPANAQLAERLTSAAERFKASPTFTSIGQKAVAAYTAVGIRATIHDNMLLLSGPMPGTQVSNTDLAASTTAD